MRKIILIGLVLALWCSGVQAAYYSKINGVATGIPSGSIGKVNNISFGAGAGKISSVGSIGVILESGSVTRANIKLCPVNDLAFVDFNTDSVLNNTGYTNGRLYVVDSAGKTINGYIKEAGSSETWDSNIVSNSGFGSDTSGWSAYPSSGGVPSLSSISGGESGNCMEVLVNLGATSNYSGSTQVIPFTAGGLYQFSFYSKDGTDTGKTVVMACSSYLTGLTTTRVNTSSWAQSGPLYANPGGTSATFYMEANGGATVGKTILYDSVVIRKVLTPSNLGVTITNSPGGETYRWEGNSGITLYGSSNPFSYYIATK